MLFSKRQHLTVLLPTSTQTTAKITNRARGRREIADVEQNSFEKDHRHDKKVVSSTYPIILWDIASAQACFSQQYFFAHGARCASRLRSNTVPRSAKLSSSVIVTDLPPHATQPPLSTTLTHHHHTAKPLIAAAAGAQIALQTPRTPPPTPSVCRTQPRQVAASAQHRRCWD